MFNKKNILELEIYVDEIEPERKCNFIQLGALFIPFHIKKGILKDILNMRCKNDRYSKWHNDFNECPFKNHCRKDLHKMNNCEIHFTEIRDGRINRSMIDISKSWLTYFYNNKNKIYSNVLYIDLNNLNTSFFGDSSISANIYNKFLRTLINYGIKSFFSNYNKIIIKNIFYDEKIDLQRHYFFNHTNLDKISYESSKKIKFNNKVIFLKSEHKEEKDYPEESHFIQFIDLILGTIRHNIFRVTDSNKKDEVARIIRPLLNKIKENRFIKSNLKVSFFPKNKIKKVTDLNNEQTYQRIDDFYYLDSFDFKLSEQSITLEGWL